MSDMEFYEYEHVNLENGLVITGFPTVGLVGTISTRFVIDELKLEPIAAFTSSNFPPISVIANYNPFPMVRAYAGEKKCGKDGECDQLIAILSELPLNPQGLRELGKKILEWCQNEKCDSIVCIEGFNIDPTVESSPLLGVGSTDSARKTLKSFDVKLMKEGMVGGLSGILLCESKKMNFDVMCLLSGTHSDYPDAKAAAVVIEVINRMVPEIEIDPEPLLKQAEEIEKQIKTQMQEAKPNQSIYPEPTMMYG